MPGDHIALCKAAIWSFVWRIDCGAFRSQLRWAITTVRACAHQPTCSWSSSAVSAKIVTQRGNACSISLRLSTVSTTYLPVLRLPLSTGLVGQTGRRADDIQMLKLWVAEALAVAA
jgi:hypothetical protein